MRLFLVTLCLPLTLTHAAEWASPADREVAALWPQSTTEQRNQVRAGVAKTMAWPRPNARTYSETLGHSAARAFVRAIGSVEAGRVEEFTRQFVSGLYASEIAYDAETDPRGMSAMMTTAAVGAACLATVLKASSVLLAVHCGWYGADAAQALAAEYDNIQTWQTATNSVIGAHIAYSLALLTPVGPTIVLPGSDIVASRVAARVARRRFYVSFADEVARQLGMPKMPRASIPSAVQRVASPDHFARGCESLLASSGSLSASA